MRVLNRINYQYYLFGVVAILGFLVAEYTVLRTNSSLLGLYRHTLTNPEYFWGYTILTLSTTILFAVVSGISLYRWHLYGLSLKSIFSGGLGSALALVTSSCPVCGSTLLSTLGIAGSLYSLPFQGLELKVVSLLLLLFSLYLLFSSKNPFGKKSEESVCPVPKQLQLNQTLVAFLMTALILFSFAGYNLLRTDPMFTKVLSATDSCQHRK